MKTRHFVTALIAALVCVSVALAQKGGAPSAAELAEITARGRMLAAYDTAAWHATDAVQAMHPAQGSIRRYIAKQTINDWVVGFGRLNDAADKFFVAYEATQAEDPQHFTVKTYEPPQEETGFYFYSARAIDTALRDFQGPNRPFNVAALPAASEQHYVYVYPAQTDKSVFVMGADARYLMSPDGLTIVEKRQMHKSILENKVPGDGAKLAGGYHTHVLSDIPEDTDVFYVLIRKPPVPEYVGSLKHVVYVVNVDGTIGKAKM
jgi:hypothetical protein